MQGQKIVRGDGVECDYCKKHNIVVDDIISFVKDQGHSANYAWTNEWLFELLDGLKMFKGDVEFVEYYNGVIDDVKDFFYDFTRPIEEFGAIGYCVEEDMIYHIGAIPEEMAEQWKKENIKKS
jgi:hypothetical protein